jgi:beta propeller repeat protein
MIRQRRVETRLHGKRRLALGALAALLAANTALPWWPGTLPPVAADTRPYNTAPLTTFESGLGAESVVTDGTSVVWVDGRGVLFSRTLADGRETRLLDTPAQRSQLALVGGVLVWVERDREPASGWGPSIRGLRLGTGEVFTMASGPGERNSPAIGIGTVVWRDSRAGNWNIHAYDLDAGREFALTTAPAPRGALTIAGRNVVWEEHRDGRWTLVAYDLAERRETPLTVGTDHETMPDVGTDALVFVRRQAGRSGGALILRDLASGGERLIVGGHLIQRPVIADNLVVWEDWRDGVPNIYAFDRATAKEFAIARGEDARSPALGGTVVVWLNRGQFSARLTAVRLVKALPTDPQDPPTVTDPDVRYFAETKHNVSGAIRQFWFLNGGIAIFGYPLSEPFEETGADGVKRQVQYFERAKLEANPADPKQISVARLGAASIAGRTYPTVPYFDTTADRAYFVQTGHSIGGWFYTYWKENGGLTVFGYPLSQEVQENGRVVQHFERARFELNPSADGPRTGVILGQLGREALLKLGWLTPEQQPAR